MYITEQKYTRKIYTVKKGYRLSRPQLDVNNQTRERIKLFPPGRVWLVTSRLETGKSVTFFTVCVVKNVWSCGVTKRTPVHPNQMKYRNKMCTRNNVYVRAKCVPQSFIA
jgi:hypothetical protein